jgi:hypothetical protein
MTLHSRRTSRLLTSLALTLLATASCGDDTCDEISAPAAFQVTTLEDGKLEIKVDNTALPVDNQALMRFHVSGEENGLWISFREDADKTSCPATARGSSDYCSILMPLQRGQTFQMGVHGEKAGSYALEGELYDYKSDVSFFESPVCRVHSQIKVVSAD